MQLSGRHFAYPPIGQEVGCFNGFSSSTYKCFFLLYIANKVHSDRKIEDINGTEKGNDADNLADHCVGRITKNKNVQQLVAVAMARLG